ncbi:hypothetical protein Nepgr_003773 [Nepenthes gracilis]|uniref:Uncharacterized protein n=1 Tax=Nepenthes gracilis TaxID=150966 RepID=A0AAD3XE46_NEPGR|nr:hypothetical protein Nepgr_003773 [Nepenthes gracilis]
MTLTIRKAIFICASSLARQSPAALFYLFIYVRVQFSIPVYQALSIKKKVSVGITHRIRLIELQNCSAGAQLNNNLSESPVRYSG